MKSLETLIPTLIDLTDQDKMSWRLAATDRFSTSIGRYSIVVWHWFNEDAGISGFSAELAQADGTTVDSVRADEFAQRYPRLEALFEGARRSAFGVTSVVRDIEREIASLKDG